MRLTPPLTTLVINLDRDVDRWTDTLEAFAGATELRLQRQPGCLVSSLPRLVGDILTGKPGARPGVLGCFLAHLGAWEKVAAMPDPWVLVIEDDVRPAKVGRLFDLDLPDDADLIWVNHGMDFQGRDRSAADLEIAPVEVAFRASLLREKQRAPAADGYLLSPGGAAKLLAAVARDGLLGHVDWRMLRYAIPAEVWDDAAVAGTWAEQHPMLGRKGYELGRGVIRAYSLSPRVIGHRTGVPSARRATDNSPPGPND